MRLKNTKESTNIQDRTGWKMPYTPDQMALMKLTGPETDYMRKNGFSPKDMLLLRQMYRQVYNPVLQGSDAETAKDPIYMHPWLLGPLTPSYGN